MAKRAWLDATGLRAMNDLANGGDAVSPQILFIIGALVFSLLALFGGGLKVKEIEFPKLARWARVATGVAAAVALVLGVFPEIYTASASPPPTPPSPSPTALPTASASSTPAPPSPTEAVTLTSPHTGASVSECAVFTGTANLRPDQTLVLATKNLSDPDKVFYLGAVKDYENPSALTDWSGEAFFGSGDSSVGQTYEVQVLLINTSTVRSALAVPTNRQIWHVTSLPHGSKVERLVLVKRIKGPAQCN